MYLYDDYVCVKLYLFDYCKLYCPYLNMLYYVFEINICYNSMYKEIYHSQKSKENDENKYDEN